ncbi:MAG: hypothetical protein LBV71_02850 [Prevotella sp.]|jgi:hypothetical protein|nr:hypothetical protein [Prevotella sp.]
MKKLFFFLFATILFASCSSDSDDATIPEGKTYKVTFNVSTFEVYARPLKAETHSNYCYYTIYEKESGKAVARNVMKTEAGQITEEVAAGNYYIAILSVPSTITSPGPGAPWSPWDSDVNLDDFNFYSDYFEGVGWINYGRDNLYAYYEKASFSAGLTNNVKMDITLQPMWSVVDIEVTDADICFLPEGTNTIECTVNPFYYGFSIAEGIPSKSYENVAIPEQSRTATSDTNFRTNKRLSGKVVSASKDVTVKLVFIKRTVSSTEILGERVIYKGDFEGGKNITLKGTLGKFASSATFNPTLGELTDGGVIPFN